MTVLDLGAIDAAPLQTDPFDFLVVPGCIRPDDLTAINGDYPNIDRPGNLNPEDTRYGPLFQGFLQELEGEELARHLGRKFGVDLTGCGTTVTVRKYCEQSDGNIHTDHPSKIITVLVYFNEGWANPEGQLRMLRSSSDIEDYAAEVP
ncbi:MAG: 2OG-Fe(II) oxygenase, partial [Gammaproteobacteria bacterium]